MTAPTYHAPSLTGPQILVSDARLPAAAGEACGGTDTLPVSHPPQSGWESLEADVTDADVEDLLSEELRRERLAHAVTRASAEQARRMADCARDCLNALLLHLGQPFAVIDRNGAVTQWNDGLARLSGIGAAQAVGKTLASALRLPPGHALQAALRDLSPAATYTPAKRAPRVLNDLPPLFPGLHARVTLIPLHHVPGTLEAIIVLFGGD